MLKLLLLLIISALIAVGCNQNTDQAPCTGTAVTTQAPSAEVATLKRFIDSTKTVATADSRGFYYSIQSPGSGTKPTICSNVTVNYSGKLTNGNTFDSGSGVSFDLNQLIVGWQEGIPLVAPGGSIMLYLPPTLAYGSQAQGSIPANSILVFKIDLVKIN